MAEMSINVAFLIAAAIIGVVCVAFIGAFIGLKVKINEVTTCGKKVDEYNGLLDAIVNPPVAPATEEKK